MRNGPEDPAPVFDLAADADGRVWAATSAGLALWSDGRSVIDAGGGFQNYPDDYKVVEEIARRGEITTRIFDRHPN